MSFGFHPSFFLVYVFLMFLSLTGVFFQGSCISVCDALCVYLLPRTVCATIATSLRPAHQQRLTHSLASPYSQGMLDTEEVWYGKRWAVSPFHNQRLQDNSGTGTHFQQSYLGVSDYAMADESTGNVIRCCLGSTYVMLLWKGNLRMKSSRCCIFGLRAQPVVMNEHDFQSSYLSQMPNFPD